MAKEKRIADSFYYDGHKKLWRKENIRGGEISLPSKLNVEKWINLWYENEGAAGQEIALTNLFQKLCPQNKELDHVLIKCATLNDFYSTNIYKVYRVAKCIVESEIDGVFASKTANYDFLSQLNLLIKQKTGRSAYSFLTKYFSHHKPEVYPIYDGYVAKMLKYYRDCTDFGRVCSFTNADLENYTIFCTILNNLKIYCELQDYSIKQVDQVLWQMGKIHFPEYEN